MNLLPAPSLSLRPRVCLLICFLPRVTSLYTLNMSDPALLSLQGRKKNVASSSRQFLRMIQVNPPPKKESLESSSSLLGVSVQSFGEKMQISSARFSLRSAVEIAVLGRYEQPYKVINTTRRGKLFSLNSVQFSSTCFSEVSLKDIAGTILPQREW